MSFIRKRLHLVLLGTDDPEIEMSYSEALRDLGCTVRSVSTQAGVLAIAERVEPDLVVVGPWLPGGGRALARTLRASAITGGIPVLLVEDDASSSDAASHGAVATPIEGVVVLHRRCPPEALGHHACEALGLTVDAEPLRELG